jgi:hypothetical protein
MVSREAHCCCGQLSLTCEGEPVRIAICHCLECQRRTGSVFGAAARFPRQQVTRIAGRSTTFTRVADSGNPITFHFCPSCGTTVYWEPARFPDTIAVAIGAFADPQFPPPRLSIYEQRRHAWVEMNLPLERLD